jgi:hypothetical protein
MLWQETDAADSFQKGCVDFGSGQTDGEIVDFLDRKFLSIHGKIKGRTIWEAWVIDRLKCEDHIISGKGVTIGPENARAEVKGERFIIGGDVPACCEARFDFLGHGVVTDKGVKKEADESAGGGIL